MKKRKNIIIIIIKRSDIIEKTGKITLFFKIAVSVSTSLIFSEVFLYKF